MIFFLNFFKQGLIFGKYLNEFLYLLGLMLEYRFQ